jgi:hypothetical protein
MDEIMTKLANKKSDERRDTENSKEATFRLYDPWEARFDDEKRRIGTAG